jgi:pyruvate decarboxylase
VWDYIGFAKALHNGQGKLWTALVSTERQLAAALAEAAARRDHLCFIEARLPSDDCRWGGGVGGWCPCFGRHKP